MKEANINLPEIPKGWALRNGLKRPEKGPYRILHWDRDELVWADPSEVKHDVNTPVFCIYPVSPWCNVGQGTVVRHILSEDYFVIAQIDSRVFTAISLDNANRYMRSGTSKSNAMLPRDALESILDPDFEEEFEIVGHIRDVVSVRTPEQPPEKEISSG